MDPSMDLYMNRIWILIWIPYGPYMDPYMGPIWIPIWILYGSSMDPYKDLYGSVYGSYMDPGSYMGRLYVNLMTCEPSPTSARRRS